MSYPEPRWYDEQQSWATPRFEMPGHHSEHIHRGMCVPNAQTIGATFRVDQDVVFHNMQDYEVTQASMSAVAQEGSKALWVASAAQVADLNAAAQASCPTCANNVQHVFLSGTTTAPTRNGFKEVRGSVRVRKSGADAVFLDWFLDPRWYETDEFSGVTLDSTPLPSQLAVRNRSVVTFAKPAPSTETQQNYHHSGIGCDPAGAIQQSSGRVISTTVTKPSYLWTRDDVAAPWEGDHTVCVRVTDGGGPAILMIDPDFHKHYSGPTPDCPNVDAAGNCLGRWFWRPGNSTGAIASNGSPQNIDVTIPASVIDSLSPGLHKLVFKSDDFAECFRATSFTDWGNCPPDVRGTWTNVSVVPFLVLGDVTPPTAPTAFGMSDPRPKTVTMSWAAATDDVGVAGYRLYRNGNLIYDGPALTRDSGVSEPSHRFEVEAYDAAGNVSGRAVRVVTRTWK